MANGYKLDYLGKYSALLKSAFEKRKNFPDELCNFIVYEFDFYASALFDIKHNSIKLIGKSSYVVDTLEKSKSIKAPAVFDSVEHDEFLIDENANNQLRITSPEYFERGVLFSLPEGKNVILKLSIPQHKEFAEISSIQKICDFAALTLHLWNKAPVNMDEQDAASFSSIVNDITLQLIFPVKNIVDNSNILAKEYLSTYQLKYVSGINSDAMHVQQSIKELTELARFETGKIRVIRNSLNTEEFFNEILNNFNFENPGRDDIAFLELDNNIPLTLNLDDQKLKFVINTLLSISKAVSINDEFKLNVKYDEHDNLELLFYSEGKGFKPFDKEVILSPFTAKDNEVLKDAKISKLGMILFLKNIEALNGEITIPKNDAGRTFFNLTINGEVMETNEPTKLDTNQTSPRNKILVIEDDYATSKLLSTYLTKWGYEPLVVNSSEKTLSLIREEAFLAIILDIELPGTSGLELLKIIHENPKSKFTPVIVCSVHPEREQAYAVGFVDFFEKPINYGFLVEALAHFKLNTNSHILCVDDDIPTLNLIKKAIENAGYIAIAESDSSNVMAMLEGKDLDLAIIDLDMPEPNGYELIKLIKSKTRYKNLPIIIFTGKDDYREDLKLVDGLFEELLLKKSTKIEELAVTINEMLKRYDVPPKQEEVISKHDVIKILLAEDYKHSQIIVTRLLKKNNFENIVVVENGQEALKLATEDQFDIILMDMQMPIMNGFEATEKIRQLPQYKDVPIIALTAFAMKGDKEKCLNAGATDYIPKPIDSKEFIRKVKEYTTK